MNKEILNFVGLMNRAGALLAGTESVINGVRQQKVKFVLIDSQVSENTLKKVTDKCRYYHVPYIKLDEGLDLGLAIGKNNRKVVGIRNEEFVKALQKKLKEKNCFLQEN